MSEGSEMRDCLQRAVPDLALLNERLGDMGPGVKLEVFRNFIAEDSRMRRLECLLGEQQRELDIFEVLQIQDSELIHSRFLAWLLNPSRTHAIGDHFLKGFLKRTAAAAEERCMSALSLDRLDETDWSDTEVRLEWQFIDILVLNRKARIVCAIENKIWADEGIGEDGTSQLTVYREVLEKEFPDYDRHLVFLSPSGMESSVNVEQDFWIPERYTAVHELVIECRTDFEGRADREVLFFLDQYERTLRRNVVPEAGEIGKLAAEIYLEHRDAIEFIYRHRPDYRSGIKQILKQAIAEQEGWRLCAESADYVRFRPEVWDEFESQRTGTSWAPGAGSLLLFEFWCPIEPTSTAGPALTLGQGNDDELRRQLFEYAQQNPDAFRVRSASLQEWYTYLHEFRRDLIASDDLGTGWDDGAVRDKLMNWVEHFAREEFPRISEVVIQCMEEYRRNGDSIEE